MADLQRALAEAARTVGTPPSAEALESLERRVHQSRARGQRRARLATTSAALGLVLSLLAAAALWRTPAPPDGLIRLTTGVPTAAELGDRLALRLASPDTLRLELVGQRADFEVAPQGHRRVEVLAGHIVVQVVGTAFQVERLPGEVLVAVSHGRVRVLDGDREVLVDPGPPRRFPAPPPQDAPGQAPAPLPAVPEPPAPQPSEPEAPAPPTRAPAPPRQRVGTWRALADQGDYERAWAALQREDGPRDEPVDLLRAADVARLTGHGAQAVPPLERMVSRFPVDPRAALAAFTLGRVYLEDLGQPRQAAAAFERARRFSPTGPLAADALAREVESHARAGDSLEAQSAARRYLEAHPTGARADAVRRWGGLPAR